MELIKAIKTRRSIRKYLDKMPSEEIIKKIIDSARYAPSSKNSQPWEFIVIKNKKLIEKISSIPTSYNDYKHIKNAPLVIAVCANSAEGYELKMDSLFSACAATENLLLTAHALGLGACWTFCKSDNPGPEKAVKRLLKIPKNIDVLCLIPLGYPLSSEEIRNKKLKDMKEIIHNNNW